METNSTNTDFPLVAYKAFDYNFQCRGFQYEVGGSYSVAGEVIACANGFHACQNPWDVWDYYPLVDSAGRLTRYGRVQQSGVIVSDGNKSASADIAVLAEIGLADFIEYIVSFLIDGLSGSNNDDYAQLASSGNDAQLASSGYDAQLASSGNSAQLASSGNNAQLASSGYDARLASSGYNARLASSGNSAQLASSGNNARLASSGYNARLASSGYSAQLASSGNNARLASSGYDAQLASSGNSAQLASSGYNARLASSGYNARLNASGAGSVIASSGADSIASGSVGTYIALAEYNVAGECVGFAIGRIGEDGLKPDVAYRASGGRLVEVERGSAL